MSRLYAGTVDWNNEALVGVFYDPDLPADWRFQYYANQLPSVLVPAPASSSLTSDILRDCIEECDENFRFVLEVNLEDVRHVLTEVVDAGPEFRRQLAALVMTGESDYAALGPLQADRHINELLQSVAVGPSRTPPAMTGPGLAGLIKAACVWYPSEQERPDPGGQFMVVIAEQVNLPILKEIYQTALAWMGGDRSAAVMIKSVAGDAGDLGAFLPQARLLAELMDVD